MGVKQVENRLRMQTSQRSAAAATSTTSLYGTLKWLASEDFLVSSSRGVWIRAACGEVFLVSLAFSLRIAFKQGREAR